MGLIIFSSNLNISPKMSYGTLEWYCYVTEWHAYDFVITNFVKKWGIFCAGPCISNKTVMMTTHRTYNFVFRLTNY